MKILDIRLKKVTKKEHQYDNLCSLILIQNNTATRKQIIVPTPNPEPTRNIKLFLQLNKHKLENWINKQKND